jgi:hypothetical protein
MMLTRPPADPRRADCERQRRYRARRRRGFERYGVTLPEHEIVSALISGATARPCGYGPATGTTGPIDFR